MDRLDVMRLFTRIVERQSFTLAAQDLEWPRSTATQVIQELEKRLGVQLLQRTTRHVKATLDGEAYYRRCVAILGDVEDAEAAFSEAKPRGLLRVDVHGTLTRHFVLPALPAFLAKYPQLQLHIGEGDRLVDLVREGVDCVLRVGDLQDSAMIGRRVALLEEVTCASPAYMARYGNPAGIDDLAAHVSVGFVSSASGMVLPLEFMLNGTPRNVSVPSTVTVTSAETYVAAAKLGLGLIQVPRYHVQTALAEGSLVEVLADFPPPPTPVSLLYPHSRQLSPRVRVFIEWVMQALAMRQDIPR
ncbi:MAG TPA: LysR family transcriptional regulator [Dyella sp.]|uniref:LysR family transcriptional regulator n=1 Tax=Dyella sp. TaxID=1869338 RepID=UPI002CF7F591|nr:LysR family transcriptional regulator [Dyella sp.]HTV83911.1 LysR family transcriptional regulator [Dyella sp.]